MTQMQIRDRIVFFSVLAMAFACSYPAWAQVATTDGVDMAPTANSLITAMAGILTAAASTISFFVVRFLSTKIGMNNSEQERMVQQQVDHVATMAIQYAEAWMKEQVNNPKSGITRLTFDNMFLDVAANYFVKSLPDLISRKREMLTDSRIREIITARVAPFLEAPVVNGGEGLRSITNSKVIQKQHDAKSETTRPDSKPTAEAPSTIG